MTRYDFTQATKQIRKVQTLEEAVGLLAAFVQRYHTEVMKEEGSVCAVVLRDQQHD